MDNEEQKQDNGGWQNPTQPGAQDPVAPAQNNDYYGQPQDNSYYNNTQPQDNSYYNNAQPQNNGYYNNTQPGDGFSQSNDGFNSVNNQGYNNYVPEPEEGPGYAIAGMVCGILSIVICCCQFYVSGVLAIVGLVLSIIALRGKKPGKGMAIAGVICSAIGLVMALILVVGQIFMLTHPGYRQSVLDMYSQMLN